MGKKILSILLAAVLLAVSVHAASTAAYAAGKKLTLAAAKAMALSGSSDYEAIKNKITLAKAKYDQSVKKIKLKRKNQSTFRWSPLLSFKLPEKPTLSDENEYVYKPLELQSEIDALKHKLSDCVYGIYEKVELEFIKVYVLQEKIAFNEERAAGYESTLEKNKARLLLGEANQSDVEAIEKKLATLKNTLASDMRSYEAEKDKLSQMVGVDVTTSYQFVSPFTAAELDRGMIDSLTVQTLERDDSYYQAQTAVANALLELNTNYDLMRARYGSKMSMIDSFISQARSGKKPDAAAFKLRYNAFLESVDQPWRGSFRILFIRIPKEWFKGKIDGVRYVEDEPYALYEAALEYQNLYAEQQSLKQEITSLVKDHYENYVSVKNAAASLEKSVQNKKEELDRSLVLNLGGQMTYEEYAQVQQEYEDLQIDCLDAKAAYSTALYSFDRLTCGAITAYLNGDSSELESSKGGESYVVADEGDGVYYYIRSLVSDNMFEFGISVTDNFDVEIDAYELWVDGVRIGERTSAGGTIRHLSLDLKDTYKTFVRLYAGGRFIDDCGFDPSVYSGKLNVTKGYTIETQEDTLVARYALEKDGAVLFRLTVTPEPDEMIAYYNIKDAGGSYLSDGGKVPAKEAFRYLAAAESSLGDLTVCFYGEDGSLLYEAGFHTADQTIHKK